METPKIPEFERPSLWPLWTIQLRRRAWRWLAIFWGLLCSPVTEPGGSYQLIAILVSLYLGFLTEGYGAVKLEAWAAWNALIYSIPVYVVLCAIRALFLVFKSEKSDGKWKGSKYVYSYPKLVFFEHLTDADNFKPISFVINEAEPGGSIEVRLETDGFDRAIRMAVLPLADERMSKAMLLSGSPTNEVFSLLAVPKDRTFFFSIHKDNSNPTIVRVYLLSWNTC